MMEKKLPKKPARHTEMHELINQHEMSTEERLDAWWRWYMKIARGDVDAALFMQQFMQIVHLWDDLIDGDKARTSEDINRVFFYLMVEIPSNPFYIRNQHKLVSFTQVYINQWLDANYLEGIGGEALDRAFALRDTTSDLFSQVAFIVGGYEWMRDISKISAELALSYETLGEYKAEHGGRNDS